jgi:hypothetical protein
MADGSPGSETDGHWFDALTRRLATRAARSSELVEPRVRVGRRGFVKLLGGVVAALGWQGIDAVERAQAVCDPAATCNNHGSCDDFSGTCSCGPGYTGANCSVCAPGYYSYPTCRPCDVTTTCANHGTCDTNGNCTCAPGFVEPGCSTCATDYYGYPTCRLCRAGSSCNGHGTCDLSGYCTCSTGFTGVACDTCAPGYANYPNCSPAQPTSPPDASLP